MESLSLDEPRSEGYILHPCLFPTIVQVWAEVWPLLEPAVKRSNGRLSAQVILDALAGEEMQLWLVVRDAKIVAAGLTELLNYRTGLRTVNYLVCGGKGLKDWSHLLLAIEDWGRDRGCRLSEMGGRHGWEPFLAELGWNKTGIAMEKDLTDA